MDPRRVVDIARLSDAAFFVEVAAGLPLIHENAVRIWESVLVLAERKHYRAAQILKTVALEEAAKYLILLDAVRCPRKPDMKKFSDQLKKFYAHLARGLYAEICDWRPADLRELRVNIERECRTYYLDGPHDVDWIFRNDILRQREEAFYVDYVDRDGTHEWVSPKDSEVLSSGLSFGYEPSALRLVGALHKGGIGKPEALELIARIWRPKVFTDDSGYGELRAVTVETLSLLGEQGLLEANDQVVLSSIAELWPFPLYDFAMKDIPVDKKDLKDIQDQWYPDV